MLNSYNAEHDHEAVNKKAATCSAHECSEPAAKMYSKRSTASESLLKRTAWKVLMVVESIVVYLN